MVKDIKELIEVKKRVSDVRQLLGLSREPPVRNILGRIRSLKNNPNQNQQGQRQGILQRLFPQAQQQEPIAEQQPVQSATAHPIQGGQHDVAQPSIDYGQGNDEEDAKARRSRKMSVKNTEED